MPRSLRKNFISVVRITEAAYVGWGPGTENERNATLIQNYGEKTSEVTGFARVVKRKRIPYY